MICIFDKYLMWLKANLVIEFNYISVEQFQCFFFNSISFINFANFMTDGIIIN